jgi:hypothetical protein
VFLMTSKHGHLMVLGVDPFVEVRYTGFTDGDCLWDLSLWQHSGDGKFDGETFLCRLLIFFFGGRDRGRGGSRARTAESFSQDDTRFQTVPFFHVIYYVFRSGGFVVAYFRSSRKVPSTSMPWTVTCVVQTSITRRPVPRIEDSEGDDVPRSCSTTDSTDQWVWCFIHIRFMLYVISVICLV